MRTVAACAAAMVGLPLMRYAVNYADLLATVWNGDVVGGALSVLGHVGPVYHAGGGQAVGSALGLILAAFLTLLLALLVYVELVLRSALIVLTTTLLPLACIMAIWPRLAATLSHMVGFLLALLLSKFVVATAVYLGFAMVVQACSDPTPALATGIATLAAAALSPIVLLQGIRFAEASTAHATRGFSFGAARSLSKMGTRLGRRLPQGTLGRLARSATSGRVQRRQPTEEVSSAAQ